MEPKDVYPVQNPASTVDDSTIYPVVLRVSEEQRHLKGREKVQYLSQFARKALAISAKYSGIRLEALHKDENGAPLPVDGTYWSLSHKSTYVAGVVSKNRIGIDLEKIRFCSKSLYKRIAAEDEWTHVKGDPLTGFFRYWTAKEAVLKAAGIGMRDMSNCKIIGIQDNENLTVLYQDRRWFVRHYYFDRHIAAIVKNGCNIQWICSAPGFYSGKIRTPAATSGSRPLFLSADD